MKTNTLIVSIVISLVVGSGIGYSLGKGMSGSGSQTKELQDSIVMMKEQSSSIQKMAEIMKSSGILMQEMGVNYKNDDAVSKGKDMEMMGAKYIKENVTKTESSGTMKNMMGN
jgi:hypothetical protein